MSHFSNTTTGIDGVSVGYRPAVEGEFGTVPASVVVRLTGTDAYLSLSIADARLLFGQLPTVFAEHNEAQAASSDRAA
ncbi:hypothetical protein [Nocardia takedensis]|uniref:hypothetical protein n=1 Tax=Nocardia takedensis TaxID=259390 RepID=UPI0012F6D5A4|nr:hypothetical protein [Nocardia takedensis]